MPKKTKAIKQTDRKKAWYKKHRPSEYLIETKEANKIILIVCEGQTEKLYFESFPVLTLTVQAVNLGGQSKLVLIDATDEIARNNDYDKVWCVFDMDVTQGKREFSDFDNAILRGHARGYEVAYSNDSFELWFYLHYNMTDQRNHRDFYYEVLSNYWECNYVDRGKKYEFCQNIYDRLITDERASQTNAIRRAESLFERQRDLPYHRQNPVTLVFELVRYLNANSRQ